MKNFLIAPSILSADFAHLGRDIRKVLHAGGDLIHFDVMDNHYVPNLTLGPMVLKSLRKDHIDARIDVHIMANPVESLICEFAKAGADYITIHVDSTIHLDRALHLIKDHGCKAGLAFNPTTPLVFLDYIIEKLDLILLMSVNPGFSGQFFIPSTLDKIRSVRKKIDKFGYNILLEIDGGITENNIADIAISGADIFVIGSSLFSSSNYKKVISNMRKELQKACYGINIH